MIEIPPQNCLVCGCESGTKIVCDACFPALTKAQIRTLDGIFQRKIIELYDNQCVDCPKSAETESGELCADHLETKGSQPILRYDRANAVCRCLECHNNRGSGKVAVVPKKRQLPRETEERSKKMEKAPNCKHGTCTLAGYFKGYCRLHIR